MVLVVASPPHLLVTGGCKYRLACVSFTDLSLFYNPKGSRTVGTNIPIAETFSVLSLWQAPFPLVSTQVFMTPWPDLHTL